MTRMTGTGIGTNPTQLAFSTFWAKQVKNQEEFEQTGQRPRPCQKDIDDAIAAAVDAKPGRRGLGAVAAPTDHKHQQSQSQSQIPFNNHLPPVPIVVPSVRYCFCSPQQQCQAVRSVARGLTAQYPGRAYYCCALRNRQATDAAAQGCKFFEWEDLPGKICEKCHSTRGGWMKLDRCQRNEQHRGELFYSCNTCNRHVWTRVLRPEWSLPAATAGCPFLSPTASQQTSNTRDDRRNPFPSPSPSSASSSTPLVRSTGHCPFL